MKFADDSARLVEEYPLSHPDLILVFSEFEAFSFKRGLPEPVLTELVRWPEENAQTYLKVWREMMRKARVGEHLSDEDSELVAELIALTPTELEQRAKEKFTWHSIRCAGDLRTRIYSPVQLAHAVSWFQHRCQKPMWELVTKLHGTGPHIHIGRRDFRWRMEFSNNKPRVS